MKLIGILGGTFNPIHFGHLRIAQEIAEAASLSQIKFIPSANPPHKAPPQVSAQQRAEMVQLAIQDNPLFSLDTRELARSGPSYTIDTLRSLRDEYRDAAFCLIIGTDAFANLDQWHAWQSILSDCHLILVPRPNHNAQPLNQTLANLLKQRGTQEFEQLRLQRNGCIIQQSVTALDISSSQIRSSIAQKKSPIYLSPSSVLKYIQHHQLYQHP
jgi:nicotinate-nucleotide adenylyltransferase